MNKNAKNIIIAAAAAVSGIVAAGTASYMAMSKLMKIALDRETPKSSEKSAQRLSGTTKKKEQVEYLAKCAKKLADSNLQTVEMTSRDGLKMTGHLYKCEYPKRVIIAMHGWRSSWLNDFSAIADFWHSNNCTVLYAEQRGQGSSDGEYMGFGLTERFDCLDWINWANENGCEDLPIYLCGVSMGATTVLMTAGLELPDNVCGIIADCGFTSPHDIWKHVMQNNLRFRYGGLTSLIADDICKKKINFKSGDYSTIDAMGKCGVPVLFIHGTDDHFVPIEMTYENYKACAAQKRLLIVPGAEHAMSYVIDKEGYEKAVREFWHDFDEKVLDLS